MKPQEIVQAIDAACMQRDNRTTRKYIGASNAGNQCEAFLNYTYRGFEGERIPGPVLRIFSLGHHLEDAVVKDLKSAGLPLWDYDPRTQKQWTWERFGGHFQAHADGIFETQDGRVLLEIKSMNDKKWNLFKSRGISQSHPIYYAQMQIMMGLGKMEKGLMVSYNKNNSLYHIEVVRFNKHAYQAIMSRSLRALRGKRGRISNDPSAFSCRYCNFKNYCWNGEKVTKRSCRNCAFSKAVGNKRLMCKITSKICKEPCTKWNQFHPYNH